MGLALGLKDLYKFRKGLTLTARVSNKIQAYFLSEIGIGSQTLNPHRVDYMLTKPVILSGSANWYQ